MNEYGERVTEDEYISPTLENCIEMAAFNPPRASDTRKTYMEPNCGRVLWLPSNLTYCQLCGLW